jgi:hypothetical protein
MNLRRMSFEQKYQLCEGEVANTRDETEGTVPKVEVPCDSWTGGWEIRRTPEDPGHGQV